MKKNKFLFLMLILFMACSETSSTVPSSEVTEEQEPQEWHTGIGETPESFVSNWNILVNSISDDPQTIDFFSIKLIINITNRGNITNRRVSYEIFEEFKNSITFYFNILRRPR